MTQEMTAAQLAVLERILEPWRPIIGQDYLGYRNHLCRLLNCCLALHDCSDEAVHKLTIAAVFHDIGLWTEHTLDYIEPSIPPAMAFLEQQGLEAWAEEITLMISEHHKVSRVTDRRYPLVEVFRQADLIDFSLGMVRFGLPRADLGALRKKFPNHGFHAGLAKKAAAWFVRHPLNPAPMLKR